MEEWKRDHLRSDLRAEWETHPMRLFLAKSETAELVRWKTTDAFVLHPVIEIAAIIVVATKFIPNAGQDLFPYILKQNNGSTLIGDSKKFLRVIITDRGFDLKVLFKSSLIS